VRPNGAQLYKYLGTLLMSPTEQRLHAALDSLHTRDDFVRFVELLVESFNEPGPPWENATMESFLAALARAAHSLERYYDSPDEAARNVASPSWEAIAGMLFSARCARVQE
jgi:hypothetical protein